MRKIIVLFFSFLLLFPNVSAAPWTYDIDTDVSIWIAKNYQDYIEDIPGLANDTEFRVWDDGTS